jgi:hypothetical protein
VISDDNFFTLASLISLSFCSADDCGVGMWGDLKRRWPRCIVLLIVLVLAVAAYPAWRHFYPVVAAEDWGYKVFAQDIPMVSALAMDDQGQLFISEELTNQRGIISQRTPDGAITKLVSGLSKPDGLVMLNGGLVISQEGGVLPVLWAKDGQIQTLFEADSVESVATDGQLLYAIEDRKLQGRLLRYDPQSQQVSVLREGLDEGEGITVCPDGQLFYTEKAKGWVKRFEPTGQDTVVAERLRAPGFVQCTADGLWVTEDATHGARLLLLGADGQLTTVLEHLRSAQTIIELGRGHYLLSEQGRSRVLEVYRVTGS